MATVTALQYQDELKPGLVDQTTEIDAGRKTWAADPSLAPSNTRASSQQTYLTIRCLADHDRVLDAYRAYAYFRWLDDCIDQNMLAMPERMAFVERQQALISQCFGGMKTFDVIPEEQMLVDLIHAHPEYDSGLQTYLQQMMAVMAFDARRRGRLISQAELTAYTSALAAGVTEALHYFIGHKQPSPQTSARYLAVAAAHITHMLRDTCEDVAAGYFNVPREFLDAHGIGPSQVNSDAYRLWVRNRVRLARVYFESGKRYLAQVRNLRCRLAGYAYVARFEWVLDAIEADHYQLRPDYSDRKSLRAGLSMAWSALSTSLGYSALES